MARELLSATAVLAGHGLHSGRRGRLQAHPAPRGAGLRFVVDAGELRAHLSAAVPAVRCTVLTEGRARVRTPEHLLAALAGLGIWDAVLCLDGTDEVPALDGSAAPFVRALLAASRRCSPGVAGWRVVHPVCHRSGRSACHLFPARRSVLECVICFDHPGIGHQHHRLSFERGEEPFVSRVAPARTFGLLGEAAELRRAGLARGANLGNTLVLDDRSVLNPGGTRFVDEPVRHKVLDALGDLALLGGPLLGRVKLVRPSHRLLLQTLGHAMDRGALVRSGPDDRQDE